MALNRYSYLSVSLWFAGLAEVLSRFDSRVVDVVSREWVLVDVLDELCPFVVAVGSTARKRVPLKTFLRSEDQAYALEAIRRVRETHQEVAFSAQRRSVAAKPISEDSSRSVHAVWLRIGYGAFSPSPRPLAWAFTWDLNTGQCRRSAIVGDGGESWSSLGVEPNYSVAECLGRLDLGSETASVLSDVIADVAGRVVQMRGVEQRPNGDDRHLLIVARFVCESGRRRGRVRGFSVELGSAATGSNPSSDISIAETVAKSLRRRGEFRALLDPDTLVVLYWDGDAPERVRWRQHVDDGQGSFVHADDVQSVRSAARTGSDNDEVSVRIAASGGGYMRVSATALTVILTGGVAAILLVFTDGDLVESTVEAQANRRRRA